MPHEDLDLGNAFTPPFVPLFPSNAPEPETLPLAQPQVPEQRPAPAQVAKVLHLINGEHFSGAERVQQRLGLHFRRFGIESQFACVKPGKFREYCGLEPEQVVDFPMRRRIDLSVVNAITQHSRDGGFDLLHAHTPRTAMVASLVSLKTGLPWVYHVHSPTARDSTRHMINRVNEAIERYAIQNCDRVLTVSKSLRREMLRLGVPRSRLQVVPNGVPALAPIDPVTRLGEQHWRLGMVALMRPRKGVEVALQALQILSHTDAPVELMLIGGFETPAYQDQTLRLIQSLGLSEKVNWVGFTNDIPSVLQQLDALVLPSLFGEGMPMVVLEALSAAVPVIATSVEGTPEVVRDGVEGVLAAPRDAESLASAIQRLTRSRTAWKQLSDNALQRHRKYYSDELMTARVAKCYTELLAR